MDVRVENELIKKAKRGNNTAFETLMNHYMKSIYNYIINHVSNNEDVKDILQEVMLGTYQSLKNFKEDASFKTWVFSITRRKIADYYRVKYNKDLDTVSIIDNFDYKDEKNEAEEVLNKLSVHEAVDQLPTEEKELVHLIFTQQLTYKEIETITNIPVGTIKSRMHHIKTKLKPLLVDEWRASHE